MYSEILISVVIPTYKGTYLKEAINSVLNQTYDCFELIIVNDASPENIDDIVSEFKDDRIKYFVNKINCGALDVVDNWNICLSYASGKYIICMGDDDCLLPNCLFDYIKLINKYPNLAVYHGWAEIIDENSKFIEIQASRPEWESVYSLLWYRINGRSQFIGDFLFNIEELRNNGGFYKLPLAWGSDDITVMISAISHGIANTNTLCFQYRRNSQTITKTGNIAEKIKALKAEKDWITNFLKKEPNDIIDKKYFFLINNKIESYFEKRFVSTLSLNIIEQLKHPIYWNKIYKKTNITLRVRILSIKKYIISLALKTKYKLLN